MEEDTSSIGPFTKMQAEANRTMHLIQEIMDTIKPMDVKNLPAVLDDFVRAAKTKDLGIIMFQITEASRKGASIQALEQVLRNVNVDCWLIARTIDPKKLEKMGELVSLNGKIEYQIGVSLCPYYLLSRSLFKEPESYVGNFEKLATATLIGSKDMKAAKEFAAEWAKEDPQFGCDTLHIGQ